MLCEMFASVDKLEAVAILCVEQLVSSLSCMNASQSAISLCGKLFLFEFVLFGMSLSLSRRITHNMLCCGVTRPKFMVSLYSCSVAHLSLTHLLWFVHQVSALPLAIHSSFL